METMLTAAHEGRARRVLRRHTLASSGVCPIVCPNAVREPSFGSQRQPRTNKKRA